MQLRGCVCLLSFFYSIWEIAWFGKIHQVLKVFGISKKYSFINRSILRTVVWETPTSPELSRDTLLRNSRDRDGSTYRIGRMSPLGLTPKLCLAAALRSIRSRLVYWFQSIHVDLDLVTLNCNFVSNHTHCKNVMASIIYWAGTVFKNLRRN